MQLAATYELHFKDGLTSQVEEIALSTVHRSKDGSLISFLMVFSTDLTVFDQIRSQVLQRILRSFAFQ